MKNAIDLTVSHFHIRFVSILSFTIVCIYAVSNLSIIFALSSGVVIYITTLLKEL